MIAAAIHCNAANYLRVNQIGYLVDDVKVAVIMMEHGDAPTSFCVVNADSGKKTVMHSVEGYVFSDSGFGNPLFQGMMSHGAG